jgi:hypothetical protein
MLNSNLLGMVILVACGIGAGEDVSAVAFANLRLDRKDSLRTGESMQSLVGDLGFFLGDVNNTSTSCW